MLKGIATIELTDINTGESEVYHRENLVTSIFDDVLSSFPAGIQYFQNKINTLLPIIPNGIGGILLFGGTNDSIPTNYYASMANPVIGYSDNIANKGNDPKKGEMNLSESAILPTNYNYNTSVLKNIVHPNGYQFVFDFGTDRANGEISSISLTSQQGGKAYLGSSYYGDRDTMIKTIYSNSMSKQYLLNNNPFFDFERTDVQNYTPSGTLYLGDDSSITTAENYLSYIISNITVVDFNNNCAYSVMCSGKNEITVYKLFIPHKSIGLFDSNVINSNGANACCYPVKILKTYVFTTAENGFATTRANSSNHFYGTFIRGAGNTIWGFQYANNNSVNTSGLDLNWVKIDCNLLEQGTAFTQGTWNFGSTINTYYLGDYTVSGSYFTQGTNYAVIKTEKSYKTDGTSVEKSFLYLIKNTTNDFLYGVYQIPIPLDPLNPDENWLSTIQYIPALDNDNSSQGHRIKNWINSTSRFSTAVNVIGNTIYYPYSYITSRQTMDKNTFEVDNLGLVLQFAANLSSATFPAMAMAGKPNLYYGPYLLAYSSDSSYVYFSVYLAMNYLATINNLTNIEGTAIAPILKTPDKTMKITYTIQEVASNVSS